MRSGNDLVKSIEFNNIGIGSFDNLEMGGGDGEMSAISGTRRQIKEMADGTIRVSIDIDPRFKRQFHESFPNIDMPVAIAPLIANFERQTEEAETAETAAPAEMEKGKKDHSLSKWAAMRCNDPLFQEWLGQHIYLPPRKMTAEECREQILLLCGINSRADLDKYPSAAEIFHREFRQPFNEWAKNRG